MLPVFLKMDSTSNSLCLALHACLNRKLKFNLYSPDSSRTNSAANFLSSSYVHNIYERRDLIYKLRVELFVIIKFCKLILAHLNDLAFYNSNEKVNILERGNYTKTVNHVVFLSD